LTSIPLNLLHFGSLLRCSLLFQSVGILSNNELLLAFSNYLLLLHNVLQDFVSILLFVFLILKLKDLLQVLLVIRDISSYHLVVELCSPRLEVMVLQLLIQKLVLLSVSFHLTSQFQNAVFLVFDNTDVQVVFLDPSSHSKELFFVILKLLLVLMHLLYHL